MHRPQQFARLLLWPLTPLYAAAVALRLWLYRRGLISVQRVATPVIAVGNLTVGGSGKSPMVQYLLDLAATAGLRAVCISRGYGRRRRRWGGKELMRVRLADGAPAGPELMGDEPYMLAWRNPDSAVYIGSNRAAAARLAEAVDGPDVIILDDAFQHLRLARDLNVLLVDAEQGLGNGLLLPAGILREGPRGLKRADAILITKAGLGDAESLARSLRERHGATVPIFTCEYVPVHVRSLDGSRELPLDALRGRELSLLCAIAQPGGFAHAVRDQGAGIAALHTFADHHPYHQRDVDWLDGRLAAAPAEGPAWLTTEKDAGKLRGRLAHGDKLWVLEMEVVPEPAAAAFCFDFLSSLPLR